MYVSFLDLKRQYTKLQDQLEKKVIDILQSGSYIMGPDVKKFEENMASYLGVKHVITVANGTEALVIALKAANVKPGDEVITTSFSFFATAEAISTLGAIPKFVDIDEDTLNIDPKKIESAITNKTKAILPVHIFGKCANMDAINMIAKKHNLLVVEDACQAIGASYKNKMAGGLGDLSCFSFYPTKNLGCAGDGGMITTNDDNLALICSALKSHGAGKIGCEARNLLYNTVDELNNIGPVTNLYDPYKYYNYLIAYNSRLDSIQAGILDIKLKYLDEYNNNRSKIAEKYISSFKDSEKIICPTKQDNQVDCWHQFAIRVKDKEKFCNYLTEKGIGNANFYPVPLHLQKAYLDLNYKEGDLPVSEKICKEVVCLPIFPELTDKEVEYVIKKVLDYNKGV